MKESQTKLRHEVIVSLGLFCTAASVLAVAFFAARAQGSDLAYVLKDVASLCTQEAASLGPHAGAISSLGIMLWTAASAVSLLAGWILMRCAWCPREQGWFMLVLGIFSGGAALDDQFQIHERVLPAAGVPQGVYSIVYAGTILTILVVFRRLLSQHYGLLLVLALGALGLSTMSDMGADYLNWAGTVEEIVEDALKFIGIVMWTSFVVGNARWRLEQVMRTGPHTSEPALSR